MLRMVLLRLSLLALSLLFGGSQVWGQWQMGVSNQWVDGNNTQVFLRYEALSESDKQFYIQIHIWPEDRSRQLLTKELRWSTNQSAVLQQQFQLEPGGYHFDVEIKDLALQRYQFLSLEQPYYLNSGQNLLLSDIFLSLENDREIAFLSPLLIRNLPSAQKDLYFFLEMYPRAATNLRVQSILYQENPQQTQTSTQAYLSLYQNERQVEQDSTGKVFMGGALNLEELEAGEYMIHLLVYEEGYLVGEEKSWFTIGGDIQLRIQEDLPLSIRMMEYILPGPVVEDLLMKEPEDVQREEFEAAWKRLYPEQTDMHQEAYYQRIFEANQRFSEGEGEGWQSARGKIFIQFGEPREKELERNGTPYLRWTYAKWSLSFLFKQEEGRYVLVNKP
ncbi:MAG: GWxTD domain-containing protein [Bacteroidota bacterium]